MCNPVQGRAIDQDRSRYAEAPRHRILKRNERSTCSHTRRGIALRSRRTSDPKENPQGLRGGFLSACIRMLSYTSVSTSTEVDFAPLPKQHLVYNFLNAGKGRRWLFRLFETVKHFCPVRYKCDYTATERS